jgi:hypothetical protein
MKYLRLFTYITLLLNPISLLAQAPNKKLPLFDTFKLGIRYGVQEFSAMNRRLGNECNCEEGTVLKERSIQNISFSTLEPLNENWALGFDFGGAYGKVMNDEKQYKSNGLFLTRLEAFYHLFGPEERLRPYLAGGVQFLLQHNKSAAYWSVPLGAGIRINLNKGGFIHLQTAYDKGYSKKIASNLITNIGFHVPAFNRKRPKDIPSSYLYNPLSKADSLAAKKERLAAIALNSEKIKKASELFKFNNPAPSNKLSRIVYFEKNRVRFINETAQSDLASLTSYLNQNSSSIVKLIGFRPHPRRKVKMIYRYFINQGITTDRIQVSYYRKGLTTTSSSTNKRRVEIIVE